jgi:hypothetical protein
MSIFTNLKAEFVFDDEIKHEPEKTEEEKLLQQLQEDKIIQEQSGDRPFSSSEANREYMGTGSKLVQLKEDMPDITGKVWAKGSFGRAMGKQKLTSGGFALVIWPPAEKIPDNVKTPRPIVVRTIGEYKKLFTKFSD